MFVPWQCTMEMRLFLVIYHYQVFSVTHTPAMLSKIKYLELSDYKRSAYRLLQYISLEKAFQVI